MRVVGVFAAAVVALATPALAGGGHHVHGYHAEHGCTWTSPHGHHFDLSKLEHHTYHYPAHGYEAHMFSYTMGVCNDIELVPPKCEHLKEKHPSVAYQMAGGWCFALGDVNKPEWNLIDDANPHKGVELTYKGGQPCSDGREREIRYHFYCSKHWDAFAQPHLVFETKEKCHYNVTWPSRFGCPTISYTNPHTWGFFDFLYYITLLFLLYLCVGCCMNITRDDVPIGWSAMPNRDFWEGRVNRFCPRAVARRMGLSNDARDTDVRFERFPMKSDRGFA